MSKVVHVHIPNDFEGEIHLHVGGTGVETTTLPGDSGSDVATTSAIEEILGRFEAHDSTTAARAVFEALVGRGWKAFPPASRTSEAKSKAAYIRLVYNGAKRTTSIYLNTVAIVFARKEAAEFNDAIEAAELRADDALYLYFSEGRVDQALEGIALMERWADGEWEG